MRIMSKFDDLAEQMAKELSAGTSSSIPGANPFPGSTYSAPPEIVEGRGGLPSIVMHHKPSNQARRGTLGAVFWGGLQISRLHLKISVPWWNSM